MAQVWALAVAPKNDKLIATGGGDSIINIWEDKTEDMDEEDLKAQQVTHAHYIAYAEEDLPAQPATDENLLPCAHRRTDVLGRE